jgi:V8-like Glu-specific endopeptidase
MRTGPHSAWRRGAGAFACAATLLLLPAGAAASERLQPAATPQRGEAARIASYWTVERMRTAVPLDAPRAEPLTAQASFAPIPEPTVAPFTVNGRLFVRQGRKRGFCSATAINSASRRLVLTAAHCVNSGPRGRRGTSAWSRYLEFVPAYTNGTAPFGAFIAGRNSVFAPRQWVKFANPNFDVGAILTEPNAEGVNVADAVGGGASIVIDQTRRQEFQTFGYPRKTRVLQGCDSPYVGDDPLTYRLPGPPTIAIRCHWAPGASGGGWLTEGGTLINGVTSYGKQRDTVHTFGPYFSAANVGKLVAGL